MPIVFADAPSSPLLALRAFSRSSRAARLGLGEGGGDGGRDLSCDDDGDEVDGVPLTDVDGFLDGLPNRHRLCTRATVPMK